MKVIKSANSLTIPEGIELTVRNRVVTVTGVRGSLTKKFNHAPVDLKKDGNTIVAEMWFGSTRDVSVIKTTLSHITNMFTGVTKGFLYKMRFAYAHFPVGVTVEDNKIEIRNFLGEKRMRVVALPEGVKASRTEASVMKDELVLEGNCINEVSQTAAQVHGVTLVKRKDIRKFLDGIYVSAKQTITA